MSGFLDALEQARGLIEEASGSSSGSGSGSAGSSPPASSAASSRPASARSGPSTASSRPAALTVGLDDTSEESGGESSLDSASVASPSPVSSAGARDGAPESEPDTDDDSGDDYEPPTPARRRGPPPVRKPSPEPTPEPQPQRLRHPKRRPRRNRPGPKPKPRPRQTKTKTKAQPDTTTRAILSSVFRDADPGGDGRVPASDLLAAATDPDGLLASALPTSAAAICARLETAQWSGALVGEAEFCRAASGASEEGEEVKEVDEKEDDADDGPITLDVGGRTFRCQRALFADYPDSVVGRELRRKRRRRVFFFDRNPRLFEPVLDFLRTGNVRLGAGVSDEAVQEEARYFGVWQAMFGPRLRRSRHQQSMARKAQQSPSPVPAPRRKPKPRKNPDERKTYQRPMKRRLTAGGRPVVFAVRDNENLQLTSVQGAGRLVMVVLSEDGVLRVPAAVVFDSNAYFFMPGQPVHLRLALPGGLTYSFHVESGDAVDVLFHVRYAFAPDDAVAAPASWASSPPPAATATAAAAAASPPTWSPGPAAATWGPSRALAPMPAPAPPLPEPAPAPAPIPAPIAAPAPAPAPRPQWQAPNWGPPRHLQQRQMVPGRRQARQTRRAHGKQK